MSYQSFTKTSFAAVSTVMALQSQGLVQANMQENNWSIDSAKEIAQDLFPSQERSSVEKVAKDKYSSSSCKQSTSGHRIDSLPYWSMDFDLPCMYSGNLLSSDTYENYFFYWLAPRPDSLATSAEANDSSPLIVYLNGGPGSTSMNALWTGNGPLRVTETGSKTEGKDFEITYDTTISW